MGSEIWKPNHLKSREMAAILSKTIWNLDKSVRIWVPFKLSKISILDSIQMSGFQMVWFSNGWDYSYSHSLSPTSWKPDHLKSDLQKVRISKCFWISNGQISDPHCINFFDHFKVPPDLKWSGFV